MIGRDLIGRTKEKHKATPKDLDPKASPNLEEIWFGGNVDLDLLSLFPLKGGKNQGGVDRRQALKKSTMEERVQRLGNHWGRRPLK